MNDKDEALYVKACVIPANEEDSTGDRLSSEDIKRIFTSFNNKDSFEIYHHGEQVDGITLLENYINKAEEPIGDRTAPVGSWLITMKITNPTIQEMVNNHEFEGVSLSSQVKKSCGLKLPALTTYTEVGDMECLDPMLISLVGKLGTDGGPANGYPLEVMNYTTYINKSKNGGKKVDIADIVNALKDLIKKAEGEPETEKAEEPEIKKEEAPEEEAAEEEVAEEDDDRIAALEERVTSLEKAIEALQPEENEEVKPKINKNNKRPIITDDPEPIIRKSFNERTGRDSFGRKIRN